MKKKFFILLLFVISSIFSLFIIIRYFNQQAIIENKVIFYLPPSPSLVIQIKSPDELYNRYLMNNNMFKKISFSQKHDLLEITKKLDSLFHVIHSSNIHLQNYSFLIAFYAHNQWIFTCTAQRFKDIEPLKNFLSKYHYLFTEVNGNFFISHYSSLLNQIKENNTLTFWKECLINMNKNPGALHIYQNTDTSEVAYQVNFSPSEISLNGYLQLKQKVNYAIYPKFNSSMSNIDSIEITPFSMDDSLYPHTILSQIKNNYSKTKVQLKQLTILPMYSTENISENLNELSDSVFYINEFLVYKIKKNYIKYFSDIFYSSDSVLFINCNEHSMSFTNSVDKFTAYKDFISKNFLKCSYRLAYINNLFESQHNNYSINFPVKITLANDNNQYSYYSEIFSTSNNNYFSFICHIKQNPSKNQYLWSYSHHIPIKKILGLFDDHKTNTYFILLQDSLNNLICLNANAEKLWSYSLSFPVMSEIFNVDVLKNNKHQIIFNTSQGIYLLDRNGKTVGRFPIRPLSEITNPVNVIDYENNKNYRIWFSTKNNFTYNYTMDAKLAEQFRPYYFHENIDLPVSYISVGLSDYISLISQKGSIVAISRKGDGRFLLKNKIPSDILDYLFDVSNSLSNSYLYFCNKKALCRISLMDELKCQVSFNEKIYDAKFLKNTFASPCLITLLEDKLNIYNLKGECVQSIPIDSTYNHLNLYSFLSGAYFVLSNHDSHLVIKYDMENKMQIALKNIESTTVPFIAPLFKDNQLYLIYTQQNKIYIKKISANF
ncbi:MAG: hypothetical protein N2203_02115 [Bacteroidia bacterium]|nr:hypothetical protein [Bacteroidia bacterium]